MALFSRFEITHLILFSIPSFKNNFEGYFSDKNLPASIFRGSEHEFHPWKISHVIRFHYGNNIRFLLLFCKALNANLIMKISANVPVSKQSGFIEEIVPKFFFIIKIGANEPVTRWTVFLQLDVDLLERFVRFKTVLFVYFSR